MQNVRAVAWQVAIPYVIYYKMNGMLRDDSSWLIYRALILQQCPGEHQLKQQVPC